eukprot:gene5049-906_t
MCCSDKHAGTTTVQSVDTCARPALGDQRLTCLAKQNAIPGHLVLPRTGPAERSTVSPVDLYSPPLSPNPPKTISLNLGSPATPPPASWLTTSGSDIAYSPIPGCQQVLSPLASPAVGPASPPGAPSPRTEPHWSLAVFGVQQLPLSHNGLFPQQGTCLPIEAACGASSGVALSVTCAPPASGPTEHMFATEL